MWKPVKTGKDKVSYKEIEQQVTDVLVEHMAHVEVPKTRPLCNAYSKDDLPDIHSGTTLVRLGHKFFRDEGAKLEELTDEKLWEYGTAIQILLDLHWDHLSTLNVLDVYPGYSPLGPALKFEAGMTVTEYEPDLPSRTARDKVNDILKVYNTPGISVYQFTIDTMPAQEFDAVFCTSVVHLTNDPAASLKALGARVRRGGVLFITMIATAANMLGAGTQGLVDGMNTSDFVTLGTPDFKDMNGKLFRCAWIKK